jgi:hypothetical protein
MSILLVPFAGMLAMIGAVAVCAVVPALHNKGGAA